MLLSQYATVQTDTASLEVFLVVCRVNKRDYKSLTLSQQSDRDKQNFLERDNQGFR